MKDLTDLALQKAKEAGAEYADIRIIDSKTESVRVKNGAVTGVSSRENKGFGIRVLIDGAWGFASSSKVTPEEIARVAENAAAVARASAMVKRGEGVKLSPVESVEATWKTTYKEDPFDVKPEDRIELLLEADKRLKADEAVRVTQGFMDLWREHQVFASTENSYIEQEITESGAGISATAVAHGEVQTRSYNGYRQAGYEYIKDLDLIGRAKKVGEEASALTRAPQCPSGYSDIILDPTQVILQVHESCGHPVELDRVFGQEASYAGTSFLTPEKLGNFKYGSDEVSIVADATIPGGLGTFAYDDEGVKAQRVPIIDHGQFVNYLSSRDTAPELGQVSNGTMRADGWNRIPIIRMTNINLEPGDWDKEEMIRDTKDGILLDTNRSWSIDDKRLNFQFGTEIGYVIKDGEITGIVKNPTYTGITPEFWNSCDAVGNKESWELLGVPNCGKGEPGQVAHVGHSAAPARFRHVRVGVGKW